MVKMKLDEKILEEISKYHRINNYILEQDAPPPPADPAAAPGGDLGAPPADPTAAGAPPADAAAPGAPPAPEPPAPIDVEADKDVEKLDDKGEEKDVEELDITDLVNTQQTIQDKQEEYFDNLFTQLKGLEDKLAQMDDLVSKINNLETTFEKYRPKTAKEKLELRSLDSGPFNQKLSDFFEDKQEDIEKSGKNEYVLTTDDVEQYSPNQIEDSFNDFEDNEEDTDMM